MASPAYPVINTNTLLSAADSSFVAVPSDFSIETHSVGGNNIYVQTVGHALHVPEGIYQGAAYNPVLVGDPATGLHNWSTGQTQTTVGAAGSASAPPASPQMYLQVIGSDGVLYVVAAYKAS